MQGYSEPASLGFLAFGFPEDSETRPLLCFPNLALFLVPCTVNSIHTRKKQFWGPGGEWLFFSDLKVRLFNSVEILPFRIYSIVLSLECVNYMALEIFENRRVNIQNAPSFKEYISRHSVWTWFLETLNHQDKIKNYFWTNLLKYH